MKKVKMIKGDGVKVVSEAFVDELISLGWEKEKAKPKLKKVEKKQDKEEGKE